MQGFSKCSGLKLIYERVLVERTNNVSFCSPFGSAFR